MAVLGIVRGAVLTLCAVGIAGMIVGSVGGNNNGVVITFGLVTAVAVVVLMAVASASRSRPGRAGIDDDVAAGVERRVQALVAAGVDERALRDLVVEAVRLGSGRVGWNRERGGP
jgi:hypothetical protein